VIGAVQGTLGGLLFWVLDLPAPVLCGMLMGFLSFVPAVGPAVIWGPAAVILLFTGELAKGIIILAVGTLAIGLVDNVLRPVLVGRDTRMPDFLVLLATIGGLAVFGVSGFVIGPILASFFVAIWGMFEQEFRDVPDIVNPAEREPANHRTQRRAGAA
jgi:predicted PurR-regulated permease PerM